MTRIPSPSRQSWRRSAIAAVGAVGLVTASGLSGPLAAQTGATRVTPDVVPSLAVPMPAAADAAVAVDTVLTRYRLAVNALDATATKAVWPGVDERLLARAFGQIQMQEITFADCQTNVTSTTTRADITCRGSIRYVPRIGARTERVELRRWRFVVVQSGRDWHLESVDSRSQ